MALFLILYWLTSNLWINEVLLHQAQIFEWFKKILTSFTFTAIPSSKAIKTFQQTFNTGSWIFTVICHRHRLRGWWVRGGSWTGSQSRSGRFTSLRFQFVDFLFYKICKLIFRSLLFLVCAYCSGSSCGWACGRFSLILI